MCICCFNVLVFMLNLYVLCCLCYMFFITKAINRQEDPMRKKIRLLLLKTQILDAVRNSLCLSIVLPVIYVIKV